MKLQTKSIATVAGVSFFAAAVIAMIARHRDAAPLAYTAPVTADVMSRPVVTLSDTAVAQALSGSSVQVSQLSVREVDGIVILSGKVAAKEDIERAGNVVKNIGFSRVANMIQVAKVLDDSAIERDAERQLARTRALDGCKFSIDSNAGVLTVSGRVQRELQADAARNILRTIDGVREVRADLKRF
ncbi:MAG TPA: BON domain-containing protein [Thermoanaerobaculia bacterium]|nr:BON domain-containing protein [Thermoanaerobaculia bacterium]